MTNNGFLCSYCQADDNESSDSENEELSLEELLEKERKLEEQD